MRIAAISALLALAVPAFGQGPGVATALRESVEAGSASPVVAAFYQERGFEPVWLEAGRREELVEALRSLSAHGLEPGDFPVSELLASAAGEGDDGKALARRDLRLTAALAEAARQVSVGKVNPRRLYSEWNFAALPETQELVQMLKGVLGASGLTVGLDGAAPQGEDYAELRRGLAHFRERAGQGAWRRVAAGPSLKAGMVDPRVAELRARLEAEGEPVSAAATRRSVFDSGLAAAVARFQARHGLEPDGAVGNRTLAALNVSAEERAAQIRANLERLRWIARDRVGDHLMVDIPGYSARLYLDGQRAWDSRVIVGKPYRKTPAFRADLTYLVLNPRWVVPPTILREDVIPKVARDPAYLAAHSMTVVDGAGHLVAADAINWHHYTQGGFPYQIVQVPGPKNPLGQIKFMLPNPYAIYLHDTPSRRLFMRSERAESSGCIRLEKPLELAVKLLDDPGRWSLGQIQAALDAQTTRTLNVKRRVPVLILYFTAQADKDGGVTFRQDLYERDPEVLTALARPVQF
ncbi:MAG: L,D-transpeptidase family protein [Zoogloeaceae bacterium]|nr:L,D-transpeptidase family protein [Zoogloeaceae bacterium]